MIAISFFAFLFLSTVMIPPTLAQDADGQISGRLVDAGGQPVAGRGRDGRRSVY